MIGRDAIETEHPLICPPQRFIGKRLIEQRFGGAEGLQPASEEVRQCAGDQVAQESASFTATRFLQKGKLFDQDPLGFIPIEGFEVSLPIALERPLVPIGVINALDGGLSSGADFSRVNRVVGIPFNFDDSAVPIFYDETAPGRAFPAGGGVPGGFSGDEVFGRDQVGDEFSGRI